MGSHPTVSSGAAPSPLAGRTLDLAHRPEVPLPLFGTPWAHDETSTLAAESLPIGDRMLLALSDGYFSLEHLHGFLQAPDGSDSAYRTMRASQGGEVRMPLGVFLLPGEKNVLIDLGFGPRDAGGQGGLVGGYLPRQLSSQGFAFADVDVIGLSHLHADHIGWLADLEGRPRFPRAQVHVGKADWRYFVEGDDTHPPPDEFSRLEEHILHALLELAENGRVTLLDKDETIAPGVTRLAAAGHTPGHSLFAIHDHDERALLFGDAMYCPLQLSNTDWEASSDVDPAAARRVREAYLRDLDRHGGIALGCHFPGLRGGRVLSGSWSPLSGGTHA